MKMMKIWIFLMAAVIVFAGTFVYAQENTEQRLQKLQGQANNEYVRLYNEGSREDKLLVLRILAKSGSKDDEVIDLFLLGLQEGTFFVKRKAGRVTNDFWDVRATSAKALGEIGDPRTLDHLHRALIHDPDPVVRSCVATALGKMGDPKSIFYLSQAIRNCGTSGSPNEIVIISCVEAIGEIGHKDGFVPLVKVMKGRYRKDIRAAASEAIDKLHWD
jgi:HEAT repeat protein